MAVATVLAALLLASVLLDGLYPAGLLNGLRLIMAGAGLATALFALPPRETVHFVRQVRPVIFIAGIAAVFLVLQILPQSIAANSVWASAAAALGEDVSGHATIDVTIATSIFARLLFLTTMIILVVATTIDRRRAEWALIALVIVSSAVAWLSNFPPPGGTEVSANTFRFDAAVLGFLLSLALGYLTIERLETRGRRQASIGVYVLSFGAIALAGMISCLLALARGSSGYAFPIIAAAATGALVIAIRRLALRRWTGLLLSLALLVGAAMILVPRVEVDRPLSLAFSSAPQQAQDVTIRMMENIPILGTGAGTMAAFRNPYRSFEDPAHYDVPSAASALLVEIGWPASLCLVACCVAVFGLLTRGALMRGRDSVYATLGASALVAFVLLAFVNPILQAESFVMIAATVLGLAFAQSASPRV